MSIAVGLLSGGLDSALACKIIKDQGVEVHAVYIDMPWGCGKAERAREMAASLGVVFKVFFLEDDYLSLLRNPKYGFGSALNPCIDCHAYMLKKAAIYLRSIQGDFLFTGEVLGQRPMSQHRRSLNRVEEESGLKGLVVRPLSAGLLEPTIPEQKGFIQREKLLSITGRSRKAQFVLARTLGLSGYAQPGGGCLLTEKVFGSRVRDMLSRGCSSIQETSVLSFGRYFRLREDSFIMVGRDERENALLIQYALPDDRILRLPDFPGPVVLMRGLSLTSDDFKLGAGLVQSFSRLRGRAPVPVMYWRSGEPEKSCLITDGAILDDSLIKRMGV